MYLGVKQLRDGIEITMRKLIEMGLEPQMKELFLSWIASREDGDLSRKISRQIVAALPYLKTDTQEKKELLCKLDSDKDYLVKRSQWIIGGDGWAYDIGYGGLDHVMASGEDINVLVFDTEIYSNTGGQASKSTHAAAIAKFASSGKKGGKKDLGLMMMSYRNVYVAQIAIGADKNQTLKAIMEAEQYHGPSILIAYAPCISHGIREGMGRSMANMAQAVASGYWNLYRYNPALRLQGQNPFSLDSKEPTENFKDFLMGQIRFAALAKQFPETSNTLFTKTEHDAKERLAVYKIISEQQI